MWFDRRSGELLGRVAVEGQDLSQTHALLGLATDGRGRVYAAERIGLLNPGDGQPRRILRFVPVGSTMRQSTYAAIPDLPACPLGTQARGCSPTKTDLRPVPNQIAFDRNGSLYVADTAQATVWRVPPGGGEARQWHSDARFDTPLGPNGLAIDHTRRTLYTNTSTGAGGTVWALSLRREPANPRPLATFSQPPVRRSSATPTTCARRPTPCSAAAAECSWRTSTTRPRGRRDPP